MWMIYVEGPIEMYRSKKKKKDDENYRNKTLSVSSYILMAWYEQN
jgi:hypothetical protein